MNHKLFVGALEHEGRPNGAILCTKPYVIDNLQSVKYVESHVPEALYNDVMAAKGVIRYNQTGYVSVLHQINEHLERLLCQKTFNL